MEIPRAAHHSSLDLFTKPDVLVTFDNSYEQETLPVTTENATVIEFQLNTDRNIYLDLQSIELKLNATITRGDANLRLLDTGLPNAADIVAFTNNTLHSMFSNCDVF